MPVLEELGNFDLANATPTLWVFTGPTGRAGAVPTCKGRWVQIGTDIQEVLRGVAASERGRITEAVPYDLLAQNAEDGALTIAGDETNLNLVLQQMTAETDDRRSQNENDLRKSTFYVTKFIAGNSILYGFRRVSSNWKTKGNAAAWAIFNDNRLSLDPTPRFQLENTFDFFALNGEILILHKNRFESTLSYRTAHLEGFGELVGEAEFASVFSDVAPLAEHVGVNKLRLRRMSAVRQKGHYRDPEFMTRLRADYAAYGLPLTFDADGKIVATEASCSAIITALLDHRLGSGFSHLIYDVPSASPVIV